MCEYLNQNYVYKKEVWCSNKKKNTWNSWIENICYKELSSHEWKINTQNWMDNKKIKLKLTKRKKESCCGNKSNCKRQGFRTSFVQKNEYSN